MTFLAAVFFVSCTQDDGADVTYSNFTDKNGKTTLAVDCTPVAGSAVVNRVSGGATGNYCDWTPTTKTIGAGASAIQVDFEGIYGSGMRVKTNGWFMGVVDTSVNCTDDWYDLTVSVKNATSTTIGADPNCGSFIPQNVVGAIGSAYGSNFGTVGYYTYNPTTHIISITKKVVIWKDAGTTFPTGASNPANAAEAYLVQVNSIVPTHGASVFGTVSYSYTKIL